MMSKENTNRISILIADGHQMFREGLQKLLEAEPDLCVVGGAADAEEAVRLVKKLQPDILLLDLDGRQSPALDVARELSRSGSPVRIILLASAMDKLVVLEAVQLGTWGIVWKDSSTELLIKSIRCVRAGQYWLGRDTVAGIAQALRQLHASKTGRQDFGLTPRQREIVGAIAVGCTNKDVAQSFSLSEQTVKHHVSNIFDKLGVFNRLELAIFANNHGLISTGPEYENSETAASLARTA